MAVHPGMMMKQLCEHTMNGV